MNDLRLINVISTHGKVRALLNNEDASTAARHRQAALHYRDEGDPRPLKALKGEVVIGEPHDDADAVGEIELQTDTGEIEHLANAGLLDFDDFYGDG